MYGITTNQNDLQSIDEWLVLEFNMSLSEIGEFYFVDEYWRWFELAQERNNQRIEAMNN